FGEIGDAHRLRREAATKFVWRHALDESKPQSSIRQAEIQAFRIAARTALHNQPRPPLAARARLARFPDQRLPIPRFPDSPISRLPDIDDRLSMPIIDYRFPILKIANYRLPDCRCPGHRRKWNGTLVTTVFGWNSN